MKKLTFIIAVFAMLCIAATSRAQTPQAINYQAIARNSNGDVISNQQVSFRISILQGSAQGSTVYEEIQPATTNQFGLANLAIGAGNVVSGTFNSIEWGSSTYYVKIEFDPKGGTNFAVMGTSEMLSVPYSLYSEHAQTADNVSGFPVKAALQATNLQTPFIEPETGMLVYNTAISGFGSFGVVPGYYYNAGTATDPDWVQLSSSSGGNKGGHFPCVSNQFSGCAGGTGTSNNTGFGATSLANLSTGSDNTGFGFDALNAVVSNSDNTGIGNNALLNNTASQNTAVGSQAAYNNTTGSGLVAIGYQASYTATVASDNTAVGYRALYVNTGNNNTAMGEGTLSANTTGTGNTGVGIEGMYDNTTGSNNTGTGNGAGYSTTTGSDNTSLGYHALFTNGTGSSNTAIGYNADVATAALTNATAIGANASVSSSNCLVLGSSANVGIGTSAPTALLHLDDGHIRSQQTTLPTIAVTTGNGITAAAISTNSTDMKGNITTTGTNTGLGATELTVTFNGTFTVKPVVFIFPANAGASSCTDIYEDYANSSTTVFHFYFTGGGATPSFNYFVIE